MNLFEAWAGYRICDNLSFRLGRQVTKYDQNRIIGVNNWNNVATSHDMALLMYKKDVNRLDIGFAYNNDKDKRYESNYPLKYYKYFNFIWYNRQWNKSLNTSLLNVIDWNQPTGANYTIYNRYTSGFFLSYANDSVASSFSAQAYYQYGKTETGQKVSAYFFSLKYSYSWMDNLTAWIGTDYFSGDDAFKNDNKSNTFNKLYSDSHGYLGYMDYFTDIGANTNGGGIMDIYLGIEHNLGKKLSNEISIHNFRLATDIADTLSSPGQTLKADRKLGFEIDYMMKCRLASNLELRAGYSTLFATKTMEIIKSGDSNKYQQWAWVMFTFKPVFYKSKYNSLY